MEKTIVIDGKEVTFKSTGAVPLRYKQQFGKDFFADLSKMSTFTDKNMESIDLEVFFNIAWVFAKTADKTISSPLEWLDTFDAFPIVEIIPELQEILTATIQTKKK